MKCCLCGKKITEYEGNNPWPVRPESYIGDTENRCCPECNENIILPFRMLFHTSSMDVIEQNIYIAKLQKTQWNELGAIYTEIKARGQRG